MLRRTLTIQKQIINYNAFGLKFRTKQEIGQDEEKRELPDPRPLYLRWDKLFGLSKNFFGFFYNRLTLKFERFFGFQTQKQTVFEQIFGKIKGHRYSFFKSPISGTKDALKWLFLKVFFGLLFLKVIWNNAPLVFQSRPQIFQNNNTDAQVQLKQMEIEVLKLKLEIEKEKSLRETKK